jgi:hypothetical protein
VRVLLDENFPLGLLRGLHTDGIEADHIITLGWRGASDTRIRERLQDADVLFLTHDEDFLFGMPVAAVIVVSRVRQSRPLKERIDVWRTAVLAFARTPRASNACSNSWTMASWSRGGTSRSREALRFSDLTASAPPPASTTLRAGSNSRKCGSPLNRVNTTKHLRRVDVPSQTGVEPAVSAGVLTKPSGRFMLGR